MIYNSLFCYNHVNFLCIQALRLGICARVDLPVFTRKFCEQLRGAAADRLAVDMRDTATPPDS